MKTSPDTICIPAVIYARYSSSGQREESIEGQLRDCHEYARKNGMHIIGEYVDKALTGRTDKRPDFQRMLRDSDKKIFQAVICWKMDRFARNRYDSAIHKYKLKKNGVRVFYAKEFIPEGPEGIILESVMEGYAEYYSENLSQNVKRGNYDSALELKTLGVSVLGLRKGDGDRFEIDPATSHIVRRIFEEYAAGKSSKDIISRLNEEGHRTQQNKPFNLNSIRRILQNKKYMGVYEYKDIYVEDGIPAIVSKELFQKCQAMLKLHKRSPAAKWETNFLLTTKLFCGYCGESMVSDGGTSKSGKVYHYYTCNGRRAHTCKKDRVRKDWIEPLVLSHLSNLIHSDSFIQTVAKAVLDFQEKEKDNSALVALENQLKATEQSIKNLISAIESGIVTESTKRRLMELETERAKIETGIARELIEQPTLDEEQIIYFLKSFRNGNWKDEEYQKFIVDTFLNSVYLYDEKLILNLNYSGENNKIDIKIIKQATSNNNIKCSYFSPCSPPKWSDIFVTPFFIFIFLEQTLEIVSISLHQKQNYRTLAFCFGTAFLF